MSLCVTDRGVQAQILRDAKETGQQKVFVSARTIIEQSIKEHASNDIHMLSSYPDSTSIGAEFIKGDIWVDQKRHILLASDYQLRLLITSVHWFVDGTFKLVKAPFTQLWSIHAFVKHGLVVKQVPLMFCLMSSRRKIDYDGVLRHLLTLLGQPCVQIVTSDFEAALWQSVRGVMPHVRLVGCLFHYTQALYRQIQALGLQQSVMEVYREEKSVRRVRAGSKSISDRLFILWQEYRNQQRSGLSLVQAASQLLASF